MFYEKMLDESTRLGEQIHSIQCQLQPLPDGKLICNKNGKYYKYYHRKGTQLLYIKKNQFSFAKQLALKKYLTFLSEDLSREKRAIDSYLRQHNSYSPMAPKMLDELSGYRKLLPYFQSTSNQVHEWLSEDYEKNTNHPEHLIHKSISGNTVRSKPESLIDMSLFLNKIPYRYECALHLDDMLFFPDFTIYQPEGKKMIYWEHFGMMDDAAYAKSTFSRLQIYNNYGIIPSINLIATFETKEHPLTSEEVDKLIHHYLI